MKKLPIFATILLVVGVVASLAFTHPLSSQNGVVRDYSAGSMLTIDTASGPHTYILRNSTLMWGWGSTSFVANTGGSSSSSSSSSSSTSSSSSSSSTSSSSATATPSTGSASATATPSSGGTTATATPSTSGSSSSSGTSATTGASTTVNGLGTGARVTVFAECFPGTAFRHVNSSRLTGNGNNSNGQNNVCFALAVIVRAPARGTVPATGGTTSPATAATTESPTAATTETPAVTMTPTP